jgi:cobalt-zinc-cadmium efflux system protein
MTHHPHTHDHGGRRANSRQLTMVLGLVLVYLVAEVVGGILTNSLALLADAGHMLSDAAALGLSLFAMWVARRPANSRHSYGFYRAEILAALVNGAALIAIAMFIFVEAFHRLRAPPAVEGRGVMLVAAGGLAVNLVGLWVLRDGRKDSLNVQGAWLHVLTDALGSVGAILAGLMVWKLEWRLADPLVSVVIGVLVVYSSWSLLRDAVTVLMEGAPGHLNLEEIRSALMGMGGVEEVHDLHVWSISSGMVALSAHVCVDGARTSDDTLAACRRMLHDRFEVEHSTIQVEVSRQCDAAAHH